MAFNKKIFFFYFILTSFFSKGQNVFPLFSESPKWNVLECVWNDCVTKSYYYDFDTLLCGMSYSKMTFATNINGYFRSDSLKTYFRKSINCSDKEYLIYDFSINVGDTVYVGYDLCCNTGKDTTQFVLGSIDSVNYFGFKRRRFKMFYDPANSGGPFFRQINWIQNIGSDTHPFYSFKCLWDGCEERNFLLCYDSAGTQLFQEPNLNTCDTTITRLNVKFNENEMKIFPSPFQNIVNIEMKNIQVYKVELFSYTGELICDFHIETKSNFSIVLENLNQGIYFIRIQTERGLFYKRVVKE